MNILRIYPFLPPLPGGMEKHIQRLTQEQRILGCEVTVAFNMGEPTSSSDLCILPRVNLRKVRPQLLRDLVFYTALFFKLLGNRTRYDVVHVHGDWSAFFFARIAVGFLRPRKWFASLHDVIRHKRLCRLSLSGYGAAYVTGAKDAESLKDCVPQLHWQHSGIDPVYFTSSTAEKSIDVITVCSFVPKKNLELVVDIANGMPDVSFLLVGDGPIRGRIETYCRERGTANVFFAGRLGPEDVADRLQRAKIFLLTSFAEGTPTALLEAMASGGAVVTSASNDYGEVVRNWENGFVLSGFAADEYSSAIRLLLSDEQLLRAVSRRNREQASAYLWTNVAEKITGWMAV